MKKDYKSLAVMATFLLGSTFGFSQESPKKPIKKLNVYQESQSFQTADDGFKRSLGLPPENTLSLVEQRTDELGYHHQKFQQYYNSIPVEFATTVLHAKEGKVKSSSNNLYRIKDLPTAPSISKEMAFNKAKQHVGATSYMWENKEESKHISYHLPGGELVILPKIKGVTEENKLAYKYDIYATAPLYRADVYIDAQTGDFIMENKKIHHANTPSSGSTLYNGNVSITTDSYNGSYRLRQTADGGGIQTYDMNNSTNYNNAQEVTSSSSNFTNNPTAVQAHWGAEQTHKYFSQKHNRNSYNGNGAIIRSYVSYDSNYVNAFWDGSRMTYGDGDGVNYGPLVALDIVGHEIGHGVTEYAANLVYSYESGALNESFSDIFGEAIEAFATGTNDWLMGDEIGSGGSGGALRSISNPNAYGQPDTYLGTSWYSGSGDNGGVHYNSGVQNFWFYLLSTGGSGTNDNGDSYSVTSIGMEKAAAVAYRNLTTYLSSNSQYSDARTGAIQAAKDLYGAGSTEEIAVTNAWHAVGVGAAYSGGGNPEPEDCTSGDIYLSITFDNYPEETSWTLKDASGNTVDSAAYSTSNADGSTVTKTISGLTDGDYTFTITDQYGDGICCSYGSGSYTLSSDDGTISSGGNFGNSEATNFCIEDGGTSLDSEAPSAPSALSANNITQTTVDLSWNASTDNVGVDTYEVFQGSSSLGTTTGTSTQITGLTAASSYSFSVKAKDVAGNTSPSSNVVSVTTAGGNTPDYCNSQGNDSSYEWIDLVSLNNLNNSSGNDGGYADNTNLIANLPYGSNTIQISAGFASSSYTEHWAVYIDYNQNGTFETNEKVVSGSSSSSNTLSGTFSVPTSAISGNTRMRVSMKYNASQTSCESFSYGEVEDYTVNVGQAAAQGFNNNSLAATAIGNESAIFATTIYPNPVTGNEIFVKMEDARDATYKIYDMLGKLVLSGELTQNAIQLNRLSGGVYMLQLGDGQKSITKKFVKQ